MSNNRLMVATGPAMEHTEVVAHYKFALAVTEPALEPVRSRKQPKSRVTLTEPNPYCSEATERVGNSWDIAGLATNRQTSTVASRRLVEPAEVNVEYPEVLQGIGPSHGDLSPRC